MRVPIQNGNVSKRDSIEQLAENARTGILKSSLRIIPSPSVPLLIAENYLQYHGKVSLNSTVIE